jgi:hypothetical protein
MKRSEQEKLLKEILPREDMSDFEQASLERGLTRMRQQRRRGYFMRAGAVAAVAIAVILGLRQKEGPSSGVVANSQPESKPVAETESKVQLISDDELLALFPGRSVALIGKPGQQRLVFLDQPDRAKAQF